MIFTKKRRTIETKRTITVKMSHSGGSKREGVEIRIQASLFGDAPAFGFPALKASVVAHINGQPHVGKGPTTGPALLTSERASLVTCPPASSARRRMRPMIIRSAPEPHFTCALSYPSSKYDSSIAATAGRRRTGVHRLASPAVITPRPVREADVGT